MSPIDLQGAARDHAQSSVSGDGAHPVEPNALERMRFPNQAGNARTRGWRYSCALPGFSDALPSQRCIEHFSGWLRTGL
jgi:hypothetical protein